MGNIIPDFVFLFGRLHSLSHIIAFYHYYGGQEKSPNISQGNMVTSPRAPCEALPTWEYQCLCKSLCSSRSHRVVLPTGRNEAFLLRQHSKSPILTRHC